MHTTLKVGDQVNVIDSPSMGVCTISEISDDGLVFCLNGWGGSVFFKGNIKKVEIKKQKVSDNVIPTDPQSMELIKTVKEELEKVSNSTPLEKESNEFERVIEDIFLPADIYNFLKKDSKDQCRTISQEIWFCLKEYLSDELESDELEKES